MTATSLALITGANKGIGFEVARQLGAIGMTVLVGARDDDRGAVAERNLRDQGVDAHHMALDVTDQESVDQAAQQIGVEHGRLDVLVSNAG
ncbi:MAG: SDR family NAD(P)-dependent oxidoreductase, partial [Candidatus Limnocylindrales bacterium]